MRRDAELGGNALLMTQGTRVKQSGGRNSRRLGAGGDTEAEGRQCGISMLPRE